MFCFLTFKASPSLRFWIDTKLPFSADYNHFDQSALFETYGVSFLTT